MIKYLKSDAFKKSSVFVGGVLFGTIGLKALTSKDAKKVYTNCAARALKVKKIAEDTATTIQENVEDIIAEAKIINEEEQEFELFEEAFEEALDQVIEENLEKSIEESEKKTKSKKTKKN